MGMMPRRVYTKEASQVVFEDDASHSLVLELDQGGISYTIEGNKRSEAMERDNHVAGRPIIVKTGEGNITGSASFLIQQYYSSTGPWSPYEWLMRENRASGLSSTCDGGEWSFRLKVRCLDPNTKAVAETVLFKYLIPANIKIDPAGADGKALCSFDFTDYEAAPEIFQGEA